MATASGSDQAAMAIDSVVAPLPPKPQFKALTAHEISAGKVQFRSVNVPRQRLSPLNKNWMENYTPIYENMKIDNHMNLKLKSVELKTRHDMPDVSNQQKCTDFVHAFMLGFDVPDALALLCLDDLYVKSFEIKDVKTLKGEHLSCHRTAFGQRRQNQILHRELYQNQNRYCRYNDLYPQFGSQHQSRKGLSLQSHFGFPCWDGLF